MIHEAFLIIFVLLDACLDVGILVYAWRNNHLSIGSVVALITLIDNACTPIAIFSVIYVQYKLNKTAWLRFMELLDLKEDAQLEQGTDFAAPINEIRIKDLSFSYESKEVLQSVSLTIKRGEKIAFVGESGAGKSILTKFRLDCSSYLIDHRTLLFLTARSKKIWCLTRKFQKPIFMYALKKRGCCQCSQHWIKR